MNPQIDPHVDDDPARAETVARYSQSWGAVNGRSQESRRVRRALMMPGKNLRIAIEQAIACGWPLARVVSETGASSEQIQLVWRAMREINDEEDYTRDKGI